VADLKPKLAKLEGDLLDKQLKSVNDAIAAYNKAAEAIMPGLGAKGSFLPKMTPAGPETVKQLEQVREALAKQFVLEKRKEELDVEKAKLDTERQTLISEWNKLRKDGNDPPADDPKVVSLRERLEQYNKAATTYKDSLASYQNETDKLKTDIGKLSKFVVAGEPAGPGTSAPTSDQYALENTSWSRVGQPNINNYTRLTFLNNNKLTISVYPDGRKNGTWSIQGNKVTINDGQDSMTGTISGSTLTIDLGAGLRTFKKN
jgi:hypothetical protein